MKPFDIQQIIQDRVNKEAECMETVSEVEGRCGQPIPQELEVVFN